MADDLPAGLTLRHPTESDHARVLAVVEKWWGEAGGSAGALQRALLLPRLYFQHFTDTSWVVESIDGTLQAFLVGLLSPARPEVAYVHFVGVAPAVRRAGVAAALYRPLLRARSGAGREHRGLHHQPGQHRLPGLPRPPRLHGRAGRRGRGRRPRAPRLRRPGAGPRGLHSSVDVHRPAGVSGRRDSRRPR